MACDAFELIHYVSNGLRVQHERAHLSFWGLYCGENGGTETWKVIIVFLGIKRILRPVHLLRVRRSGHEHIEQEQVVMRTVIGVFIPCAGTCHANLGVLTYLRPGSNHISMEEDSKIALKVITSLHMNIVECMMRRDGSGDDQACIDTPPYYGSCMGHILSAGNAAR